MKGQKHIKTVAIAFVLTLGVKIAFAAFSFTGITDEKGGTKNNSKYSLKNVNAVSSHKSLSALSYSSLKSSMQFKGTQLMHSSVSEVLTEGGEVSSMLKFDNGNTTYIYPYKFKVRVPKFKTPAPPEHH
ncbi:hypothetical protein SAMN05444410_12414 [Hydrobacter penzbergensis]|jgi:hypothetical protein|uniref:Uncharacterized protein n=1 Tax=Hydrobacter penzbergensis TaxID=1235997 RepID=A0A8X8IG43_9BACT|nr:hypothetical protein [Hydrobacter penzbergensis]MBN8721093.1 hypothetical protein [Sediminibacterium magnilacihabitans]PQV57345.1 hypothetical protein CLV53_12723 [Sediminibacterium magnilacihabitans]SDX66670.1 hypothetical protein SAMN05444410_12414 [Hydrobacter penzbergensis]